MVEIKIPCPKAIKPIVDKYNAIKESRWIKVIGWIFIVLMLIVTIWRALK